MFRRFLMLATLLGVAAANLVHGFGCCGDFWVKGGAIALLPTVDSPYFTILGPQTDEEVPIGTQLAIQPDYRFGWLVEGGWAFAPCWDVRVNWQSLVTHYKRGVQAGPEQAIWISLLHADPSDADIDGGFSVYRGDFRYYQLDGEVSRWITLCPRTLCMRVLGGVRYTQIRYNEDAIYIDPTDSEDDNFLDKQSRSAGVGPRFGLGINWNVGRCLPRCFCSCWFDGIGLFADGSCSLLIGESRNSFFHVSEDNFNNRTDVANEAVWRVFPQKEIRFGFDYCTVLCNCFQIGGEFGYRITEYTNLLQTSWYPDDVSEGLNFTQYRSVHLHGFFLSLGVRY